MKLDLYINMYVYLKKELRIYEFQFSQPSNPIKMDTNRCGSLILLHSDLPLDFDRGFCTYQTHRNSMQSVFLIDDLMIRFGCVRSWRKCYDFRVKT